MDQITEVERLIRGEFSEEEGIPVLHLHGMPSNPKGMTISSTDYMEFYTNPKKLDVLKWLWSSERLFIVGFSFGDPYLMRHAVHTVRLSIVEPRHFALIGWDEAKPYSNLVRQRFLTSYRITPIFYLIRTDPVSGVEDHADLEQILEMLVSFCAACAGHSAEASDQNTTPSIDEVGEEEQEQEESAARALSIWTREAEGKLFAGPSGRTLYVAPNIYISNYASGDEIPIESEREKVDVDYIVRSTESLIIATHPEYGGTMLCSRIFKALKGHGVECHFYNASSLPKYRKKLLEVFIAPLGRDQSVNQILILDNFDCGRHERLLRELMGLKIFSRFIILSKNVDAETEFNIYNAEETEKFKVLTLGRVERSDIRSLTKQYFDTEDEYLLSAIVDKIYGDLIGLCIPLTPSNIIMYLSILHRESDFQPINRIEIVDRYVHSLLSRPSDVFGTALSAKNKIEIIGKFTYWLHKSRKTFATVYDWNDFCMRHKSDSLLSFDHGKLLEDVLRDRIFIEIEGKLYFRYRVLYPYFIGAHVAPRHELLREMVDSEEYLSVDDLPEVITALGGDNSYIVNALSERLTAVVNDVVSGFPTATVDPLAFMEWPRRAIEEDHLWKPIAERLEAGPAKSEIRDEIKRSYFGERRTENQVVKLYDANTPERKMTNYAHALIAALKNSDAIEGSLKIKGVNAILCSDFVVYRVGLAMSREISTSRFCFWNGVLFINEKPTDSSAEEDVVRRRTLSLIIEMPRAVASASVARFATRKLNEVFLIAIKNCESTNMLSILTLYAAIIRTKPNNWEETAERVLRGVGNTALYLYHMIIITMNEFHEELNTVRDRALLKRLIGIMKAKRDLGEDKPGAKLIANVLKQLDERDAFTRRSALRDPPVE